MLRVGICDDRQADIDIVRTLAARFSDSHLEHPLDILHIRLGVRFAG